MFEYWQDAGARGKARSKSPKRKSPRKSPRKASPKPGTVVTFKNGVKA